MTIKESGSLSFTDFKSGTGLTANNIQSYYRNSNVTGFAPDSGSISFSDLYGGYQLTGPNSSLAGYYYPYYPYDGSPTQYADYYSSNVLAKTYVGGYYYYNILNTLGTSGVTWPGTFTNYTPINPSYTSVRTIYSGWPGVTRSGFNGSTGTYGPYPYTFFFDHGQMIPMGAIGESSVERVHAFRTNSSVSGGGYFYFYYIFFELFPNQNLSGGYYAYMAPSGSGNTIDAMNDQRYCVGMRISTGGNLYLGRYYWPSSASSAAIVDQEISMFGSVFAHRNNQLSFSVDLYAGHYSGGQLSFYLYANSVWFKNTYSAKDWNINNLAYNTAPSNFGFKTSF